MATRVKTQMQMTALFPFSGLNPAGTLAASFSGKVETDAFGGSTVPPI
jgi:hypothetical protein